MRCFEDLGTAVIEKGIIGIEGNGGCSYDNERLDYLGFKVMYKSEGQRRYLAACQHQGSLGLVGIWWVLGHMELVGVHRHMTYQGLPFRI